MRKALMEASALDVRCPHCGEYVADPNQGSHFWEISQVRTWDGKAVDCDGCGKAVLISLPKRVAVA